MSFILTLQIVVLKKDYGDGWAEGVSGKVSGVFPKEYGEELHSA